MISPWEFLVVSLCAFRVTRFLVFDSMIGFNVESGSKMSHRIDRFAFTSGPPASGGGKDRSFLRGKIGYLLVCSWCLGFWVTVGAYSAWAWGPTWIQPIEMIWAAAGVAALLSNAERRMR